MLKTLKHFSEYFGEERPVSVSREITKLHEETIRGTAAEVLQHYTKKPPKGEIVIVVKDVDTKINQKMEDLENLIKIVDVWKVLIFKDGIKYI